MTEYQIQKALAEYLRARGVMFRSDGGGLKLPIGLAKKYKMINDGSAWPDVFIAESKSGYFGLFLELKRDHTQVWDKRGNIRKNAHIQRQNDTLKALRERGYCAEFACGLDDAIELVDDYLKNRL